jgi:predicted transposase/invertase (TIGR01784 family)
MERLSRNRRQTNRAFLRGRNPVGFALMAKAGYDVRERMRLKADFLRWILSTKVDPARRNLLIEFVETYMPLSPAEQARFGRLVTENRKYREVREMVTVYEKRGIQKGLEKGRAEGRAEGRDAERRALARKLLASGMPPTEVAELTGLPVRQVRALRTPARR